MRKIYTKTLLTALTVVGLTACGGGGDSKSSSPTYSGLADLEYKTLNVTAKFTDKDFDFTYAFKDNYETTDDGTSMLVDYRSTKDAASLCMEMEDKEVFTYICLSGISDGSIIAHALKIEDDGTIKGNFKYSKTGNSTELEQVYTTNADAPVTGTVSTTSEGSSKTTISKIDVPKSHANDLVAKLSAKTNVETENQINEMLKILKK